MINIIIVRLICALRIGNAVVIGNYKSGFMSLSVSNIIFMLKSNVNFC